MENKKNNQRSRILLDQKIRRDKVAKQDAEYLLSVLDDRGTQVKRWKAYLSENEELPIDGNVCNHSARMEELTYKIILEEGLSEKEISNLIWTARFHDLGELGLGDQDFNLKTVDDDLAEAKYIESEIVKVIKSSYVSEMMNKVLRISLYRKNLVGENFDYVSYFNALEVLGYLETAIYVMNKRVIKNWQILVSGVAYNQINSLVNYGRTFRSVREYLKKRVDFLDQLIEKNFTLRDSISGFQKIYQTNDLIFLRDEKNIVLTNKYIRCLKDEWRLFKNNLK